MGFLDACRGQFGGEGLSQTVHHDSGSQTVHVAAVLSAKAIEHAVVGAQNPNPSKCRHVKHGRMGEEGEMPGTVSNVHSQFHILRNGIRNLLQELADVVWLFSIRNFHQFSLILVRQLLLELRPCLFLRLRRAYGQHPVRTLGLGQQFQQGYRCEVTSVLAPTKNVSRWLQIRSEDGQHQVIGLICGSHGCST